MYGTYSQANVIDYNRDSTLEKCSSAMGVHYMLQCYKAAIIQHLPNITTTSIFVPILELILYTMFVRCHYFNDLKILNKTLLGILMLLLYEMSFLVEKVVIAVLSIESNSTCFNDRAYGINNEQVWSDYTNFIFQQPLFGIAPYVLSTIAAEFVCVQSLYSMKGLLGIFFVVQAFSVGLSTGSTCE